MDDNNTYYECKCTYYGEVVLCEYCAAWFDKVEIAVQEHRVYKSVIKAKRWNKPKTKNNKIKYITNG